MEAYYNNWYNWEKDKLLASKAEGAELLIKMILKLLFSSQPSCVTSVNSHIIAKFIHLLNPLYLLSSIDAVYDLRWYVVIIHSSSIEAQCAGCDVKGTGRAVPGATAYSQQAALCLPYSAPYIHQLLPAGTGSLLVSRRLFYFCSVSQYIFWAELFKANIHQRCLYSRRALYSSA